MSTNELAKIADAQSKPDNLRNALKYGNPVVWASCLVMGLANMAAGQLIKGLIFLAIEIGVIAYLCIPGGGLYWLSMMPSLGTLEQQEVWNEDLGIYEYLAGDNSQQILLYSVATLVVLGLFIVIWRASIRSGAKAQLLKSAGKKVPTFADDVKALFDQNIHKLLMAPPFTMLLVFTITPLAYMMLMAFTNYSKVNDHLILFDWVGLANFADLFNNTSTIGKQFWDVLAWTLVWAFFATFLNFFLGTIMAMIIERPTTRCKGLWRTILSFTIAVPQFVSLMIISTMFKDNGAAQRLFQTLGVIGPTENLPFWTNAIWARVTIIIVNIWVGIPYTVSRGVGRIQHGR